VPNVEQQNRFIIPNQYFFIMPECDCCNEFYEKGTGHLCLCPDCDKKHNFCDECYQHGIKKGYIKPNTYKMDELHPDYKEKLK